MCAMFGCMDSVNLMHSWWYSSTTGHKVKGKLEQTHTPSCLACSAETGNPAFGCEMTDYNLEQSTVLQCVATVPEVCHGSIGSGRKAHEHKHSHFNWLCLFKTLMHDPHEASVLIFNFYLSLQDFAFLSVFYFSTGQISSFLPLPISQSIPQFYPVFINESEVMADTLNVAIPLKKKTNQVSVTVLN